MLVAIRKPIPAYGRRLGGNRVIERCGTCGKSLGTTVQEELFGGPKKCIDCVTNDRIHMMLKVLPDDSDLAWKTLSDFERGFLLSVREFFKRKGSLSEKQYQVLENMYEKHN